MELVVEAAGVADWLPGGVPPPESGRRSSTVGTTRSLALGARLE